jgi:HD-GYP domain-containing protein (c-di-GMP phosphodiesterase class II)
MLKARHLDTALHSKRVTLLSGRIGRRLGLSRRQLRKLVLAAWLHDIGKVGTPDAVLLKRGPLTPRQRQVIDLHVRHAIEILGPMPELWHLLSAIAGHHERHNGSGQPCRLAGDSIDICARVIAVADSFDAMTQKRCYTKAGMPRERAVEIIRSEAGTLFDPEVVAAFLDVVQGAGARQAAGGRRS